MSLAENPTEMPSADAGIAVAPSEGTPVASAPSDAAAAAPALSRVERKQRAVAEAVRGLIRDCHLDRFGARPPAVAEVSLNLRVRVRPGEEWALRAEPPLAEQLAEQLAEAHAVGAVFQAGRVHCFRCDSSTCEHGTPPSAGMVFRGYSSTGQPEWCGLAQPFMAARDERVDQLYEKPPRLLTLVQTGHELRAQQLSTFGRASRRYSVLAQCVGGFFTCPPGRGMDPRDADRLAVTVQAVETRDALGRATLRLNAIPAGLPLDAWREALASDRLYDVALALGRAEEALQRLTENLRAARSRDDGAGAEPRRFYAQVPAVLHRLARELEQRGRQHARRTRHAEARRAERPVHKAQDDAREAGDDRFFFDEKHRTSVVAGPQGRAHAFNAEGKHVTTLRLEPDSIDFRLRTARWRRLQPDEIAALRARLSAPPAPVRSGMRGAGEATGEVAK